MSRPPLSPDVSRPPPPPARRRGRSSRDPRDGAVMPSTLRTFRRTAAALALSACAGAATAQAPAAHLTTPRQFFGHDIGADYQLPDYGQLVGYWRRLASQSSRIRVVDIGRTAEGRTQY